MDNGHFRRECSCGQVIAQCRCMGPKDVIVIQNGCPSCMRKVTQALTEHIKRGDA